MLSYSVTLDEIITHVHYPVASQTARYLLNELGLLEYMGNRIYIQSTFHAPSRSYSAQRKPILTEPGFTCNIRLNTNPTGVKWDMLAAQAMDSKFISKSTLHTCPVLENKGNLIKLSERYLPCGIEMDCRLHFIDKTIAYDVMTRMFSTIANANYVVPIDLSYNYRIPMPMIQALWHLAYLTGVKKTEFVQWLVDNSNNQISKLVGKNKRSKAMELVVNKHQFEAYISTEYNHDEPDIQASGTSADRISIGFSAHIQFARAQLLFLEYPIVVNNRLVPESMVMVNKDTRHIPTVRLLKYGYSNLDGGLQAAKTLLDYPSRNPWYDNWELPGDAPHSFFNSVPFFIGVFTLDTVPCTCPEEATCCSCDVGRTTISIEDLDQYKLTDTVLDYFKEHKEECLDVSAKYNITVFADDTLIDKNSITFDGVNFSISNHFGPKRIYRFVIAKTPEEPADVATAFFMLDCIVEVNKE